ncbi:uncharacterized protein [Phaseolus vulgaris]|uniref:uncharacterized protein n=1 Tax=Phaseolus vulgaris TaxID=3885 RepID=UPI0035C99F26
MAHFSSGESSKPCSPQKAALYEDLKNAKQSNAHYLEVIRKMEARLQSLELNREEMHHNRERRTPPPSRHSSRHSHGYYEDNPRPRHHHHEERRQHVAGPCSPNVKLPSFSGESDPNVYLGWEAKVDQIFDVNGVRDEHRVKLASLEFLDYAMQWWHQYLMDIDLHKRPPVVFWNDLKACLRARFVPPHFRKDLMLKLQRFHQGALSVDDYFKQLDTLLIRLNMDESEEAKIARFVSGLRRDIQDVVELQEYSSLENVVHLASKIENQLARKNAFKNSSKDNYYHSSWKNKNNSFSNIPSKDSTFKPRESKPSTSNSRPKSPPKSSSKKCFKCLSYGHIASNCPSKRAMYMHDGVDSSEHESESSRHSSPSRSPSESESENPHEGDLLVIRRMLGQVLKPFDETQRKNIFHSRCLINDRVCSLIVDGGSCANVASTRVVDKLGLPTISHAKPYKLQWLSEVGEIVVNKQVLITFSIGKYKDEVLCDVVPMEATHILLGRPWQFDRKVFHDGFTNKMSFHFHGHKVTLKSLSPKEVHEDQVKMREKREKENDIKNSKRSLLMSTQQVKREY